MKRQELVHVHALLWEVRGYLETTELVSTDAFRNYDAQSVRPPHIHRQKTDHQRAISLLFDGFETPRPPTELEATAKRGLH
jgi:hypothetical protein